MGLDMEFIRGRDNAARLVWNMLISNGIPNDKIHLYHQHIMSGARTTDELYNLINDCSNPQRINEMLASAQEAVSSNRLRTTREELKVR